MKRRKKYKKRTPLSRRRKWDKERGIAIIRYVKSNAKYYNRNLIGQRLHLESSFLIDEDSKYYNEYLNVLESRDGILFLDFIQMIIEEEFNGEEGSYWIGGYEEDCKGQIYYLVTMPVLKIYYDGENIALFGKRNYRQKYGRKKKRSFVYYGIQEYPELEDYID